MKIDKWPCPLGIQLVINGCPATGLPPARGLAVCRSKRFTALRSKMPRSDSSLEGLRPRDPDAQVDVERKHEVSFVEK
jgi:hypothetical protein